jgi:hypothetical protein
MTKSTTEKVNGKDRYYANERTTWNGMGMGITVGIELKDDVNEKPRICIGKNVVGSTGDIKKAFTMVELEDDDIDIIGKIVKHRMFNEDSTCSDITDDDLKLFLSSSHSPSIYSDIIKSFRVFIAEENKPLKRLIDSYGYTYVTPKDTIHFLNIFIISYDRTPEKKPDNKKINSDGVCMAQLVYILKNDSNTHYIVLIPTSNIAMIDTMPKNYTKEYVEKRKEKERDWKDKAMEYFKYFNMSQDEINAYKLKNILK